LAFLTQNKAKLFKNSTTTLVFEKTSIFSPKIAGNCDHHIIDPSSDKTILTEKVTSFGLSTHGEKTFKLNLVTLLDLELGLEGCQAFSSSG
jgi:hypothetical protein